MTRLESASGNLFFIGLVHALNAIKQATQDDFRTHPAIQRSGTLDRYRALTETILDAKPTFPGWARVRSARCEAVVARSL